MMHSLLSMVGALGAALSKPPASAIDRRLKAVAADPRLATCRDVELLVRVHGVPEAQVWTVVDRLARGKVDPTLAWSWTVERDGNELAKLCAAPMTDRDVVAYMAIGPNAQRIQRRATA